MKENEERRSAFFDNTKLLNQSGGNTDWNRIMELYGRMKVESAINQEISMFDDFLEI